MAAFSARSKRHLESCHQDLQDLFNEVIKRRDCTILEGQRDEETQNRYWDEGKSQLQYPHSFHNRNPSLAVDAAPYPIDWKDINRFHEFAGYVKRVAEEMGIDIEWGGDWPNFKDLPHWQLA